MFENYTREVEREVKRFRTEVTKMKESENPYFHTPGVIEYETERLKKELEQKVEEISDKFNREIDEHIEQLKPIAAKSYFRATEEDKRLAKEFVTEFLVNAKLAYTDKETQVAFERFEDRIGYLDENGLHEVRKHLPELFDQLGGNKALRNNLQSLNATFKELKTAEQLELSELKEAKASGVDWALRKLKMLHPAYSEYKNNRYYGK